jgi:hypothetical protein
MFNYVLIKHKQMSFVAIDGKFKLYTVLNGLIFSTPTQPRISFERAIEQCFYLHERLAAGINPPIETWDGWSI